MTADLLYGLAGVTLFALGLFVLVAVRDLLRKVLAFNVMASGVFLALVGLGQVFRESDPVPQALVLTGIVVAFASTALALALLRRWIKATGRVTLEEEPLPAKGSGMEKSAGGR